MTLQVRITGQQDLRRAARALREAGRVDLKKEMLAAIRKATAQIGDEVRKDLPIYLPDTYAAVLARALRFTTATKTSGWPEITVTARAKGKSRPREIRTLNRGVLRAPLFGNRKHWYAHKVKPRFFDEPADRVREDVIREAGAGIRRVREKLEREI